MVGLDARMTTWQHSTPQTANASERDCLESLHRPRNESFSLGGLFLRLDDYRAGYRGSKKGRSVYLFTGLPRRVLLGNWAAGTDISRRAVDKVYGYVGESDDGEPSRRAEEALTPAIPRSQERTKILRGG